jgi:transposase
VGLPGLRDRHPGRPAGWGSHRGFGPRVQAITALCMGAYHLSKRTTQSVMADLFGLPLSLGTITNLERATVQALAAPVAEARSYMQAQPAAYLDETGWREGCARAWLGAAVRTRVTVFVVRLSRGAKIAQELLGERFGGYLVTERFGGLAPRPERKRSNRRGQGAPIHFP